MKPNNHQIEKNTSASLSPVTLYLVTRDSGKPAVASIANSFLQNHQTDEKEVKHTIEEITSILEGIYLLLLYCLLLTIDMY